MGWQRHQLDHMQIICTSLQTDDHASTSSLIFTGRMLVLTPNQQYQSTEGTADGKRIHRTAHIKVKVKASHTRYRALGPELIPVYRQSACR